MLTNEASLLSKVERKLYRAFHQKNKSLNELKSDYLKHLGITARHFNSYRIKLEGKVKSGKKLLKRNISLLEDQIKKLKKHVQKIKDPFKSHQKQRRLFLLESRLKNLKKIEKKIKQEFVLETTSYFKSSFIWKKTAI